MTNIELVPADARQVWPGSDILSRQSFPATGNFDLEANAFGLLLVHNDDIVSPGEGFDMHFHKDMEIVSWIVEGATEHRDSGAPELTIVSEGMAQSITAGSGVRHAENNANGYSSGKFLRVIQSWLPTDTLGLPPTHANHDFSAELERGGLFPVAGENSPLPINTTGATMYVARLGSTTEQQVEQVHIPAAPFVHLFAVTGSVEAGGHELSEGDALRCTDLTEDLTVSGEGEILAWVMQRAVNG